MLNKLDKAKEWLEKSEFWWSKIKWVFDHLWLSSLIGSTGTTTMLNYWTNIEGIQLIYIGLGIFIFIALVIHSFKLEDFGKKADALTTAVTTLISDGNTTGTKSSPPTREPRTCQDISGQEKVAYIYRGKKSFLLKGGKRKIKPNQKSNTRPDNIPEEYIKDLEVIS